MQTEETGGADRRAAAWMRHMRRGEFEAAWRVSDALLAEPRDGAHWTLPRHLQRIWDGTPIDGRRVLVRCYHGLGDTIQFSRYLPLVRRRARELTVWAQEPLIPLLRTMGVAMRLLPLHDGVPGVEYDVDVEVMELPHLFRTTRDTIPADVPYLHVVPRPAAPADDAPRVDVGLVWRAGDWDDRRSVPFDLLAPLADLPGVRLHVLQQGDGLREHRAGVGVRSGSPHPLETARAMRALDLVVSVDSMPAHLAGALGVPVWTLLHAEADWRWMDGREDSPWYPSMRLFRQPRAGDWASVAARVTREVRELAARAVARRAAARHETPRAADGPSSRQPARAPSRDGLADGLA